MYSDIAIYNVTINSEKLLLLLVQMALIVYSNVIIYDVTINLEKMLLLLVQIALIVYSDVIIYDVTINLEKMALIRSIPNNHNNVINHLLDLVIDNDYRKKKQESANHEAVAELEDTNLLQWISLYPSSIFPLIYTVKVITSQRPSASRRPARPFHMP